MSKGFTFLQALKVKIFNFYKIGIFLAYFIMLSHYHPCFLLHCHANSWPTQLDVVLWHTIIVENVDSMQKLFDNIHCTIDDQSFIGFEDVTIHIFWFVLGQHPCIRLLTSLYVELITCPYLNRVKIVLCAKALQIGVKQCTRCNG
jgi:hypothetical protein